MLSTSSRRLLAGLTLAILASFALAACGSSSGSSSSSSSSPASGSSGGGATAGAGKPTIRIGDKNFTEQYLLGELYRQALEAKGFKVALTSNIGSSEITDKALTSSKIDMYPEYTGVILAELAHQSRQPSTATAAYKQATTFERGRGFTLLAPTPFADSDVLITKPAYATKNSLHSLADLKKLGKSVILGGPPENATRYEGLLGLKQAYGVLPTFKPLSIGLQYTALDSGQLNVATAFTTDGQLAGGKYATLSDPKGIFGFQNVTPVVNQKVLAKLGPMFTSTVNAVSAKLTLPAIRSMNAAAALQKQDPAKVAAAFLKANGLT